MFTVKGFLGTVYGTPTTTEAEAVELAFQVAHECRISVFVVDDKGADRVRVQYQPSRITVEEA